MKRVIGATALWVAFFVTAGIAAAMGEWAGFLWAFSVFMIYGMWNVGEGRPWYGAALLFVPVYWWWLIGKMFWSWTGPRTPAVVAA
jgi:hypothetical protein